MAEPETKNVSIPALMRVKGCEVWVVRTQAAFTEALTAYLNYWQGGDEKLGLIGPPKEYPCLVFFSSYDHRTTKCTCVHINKLKQIVDEDARIQKLLSN